MKNETKKTNETEQLPVAVVMQAWSGKQPYFKLSTNEFGKHWLFYKPLKSEPGKYSCWMPIDDEFYSEFDRMLKAALGSEATVASEGWGEANTCAGGNHLYETNTLGSYCSKCGKRIEWNRG